MQVDATGKLLPFNTIFVDANGVAWSFYDLYDPQARPGPLYDVTPVYAGNTCSGAVVGYSYAAVGSASGPNATFWTNFARSQDWTRFAVAVNDYSSGTLVRAYVRPSSAMKLIQGATVFSGWTDNGSGGKTCSGITYGTGNTIVGFDATALQTKLAQPGPQVTLPLHWETRG